MVDDTPLLVFQRSDFDMDYADPNFGSHQSYMAVPSPFGTPTKHPISPSLYPLEAPVLKLENSCIPAEFLNHSPLTIPSQQSPGISLTPETCKPRATTQHGVAGAAQPQTADLSKYRHAILDNVSISGPFQRVDSPILLEKSGDGEAPQLEPASLDMKPELEGYFETSHMAGPSTMATEEGWLKPESPRLGECHMFNLAEGNQGGNALPGASPLPSTSPLAPIRESADSLPVYSDDQGRGVGIGVSLIDEAFGIYGFKTAHAGQVQPSEETRRRELAALEGVMGITSPTDICAYNDHTRGAGVAPMDKGEGATPKNFDTALVLEELFLPNRSVAQDLTATLLSEGKLLDEIRPSLPTNVPAKKQQGTAKGKRRTRKNAAGTSGGNIRAPEEEQEKKGRGHGKGLKRKAGPKEEKSDAPHGKKRKAVMTTAAQERVVDRPVGYQATMPPAVASQDMTSQEVSRAAQFLAKKHQDLRQQNMSKKVAGKKAAEKAGFAIRPSPSSSPSKFCHICTRAAKPDTILVCSNVLKGTCRKIMCSKCIKDMNGDWEALKKVEGWTCTHCNMACPKKAQCYTYKRVNQNRRSDGRRATKLAAAGTGATSDSKPTEKASK